MPVIKTNSKPEIEPVWQLSDGLSYSALSTWLNCREQFRLKYVCGWTSCRFSFALEFGSAFHHLLEIFPGCGKLGYIKGRKNGEKQTVSEWSKREIEKYSKRTFTTEKTKRFLPADNHELKRCLRLVVAVFPHYATHYQQHDMKLRWKSRENIFKFAQDGSTQLTGKIDGVVKDGSKLWLFETKTKGQIDESAIRALLHNDLQTMLYAYAIQQLYKKPPVGIIYNVVKRPGIQLRKDETTSNWLERVENIGTKTFPPLAENPEEYFLRWRVTLEPGEVDSWADRILRPILSEFVGWWHGWESGTEAANCPEKNPGHYPNPAALYFRNQKSDMFHLITTGNSEGLYQRKKSHPELVT